MLNDKIAQIVEDYMVVTRIVMKSDIDIKVKRIFEKLYYRSKELVSKSGIEQCYMEEIDSLRKKLGEQTETAQKLVIENKSLRQSLKSRCNHSQLDESLIFTRNSFKNDRKNDTGSSNGEFLSSVSYLLQIFNTFNKEESQNTIIKSIEYNCKKALSCESIIILQKKSESQCEGVLFDKIIAFSSFEKYISTLSPILYNTPTTDDLFTNKVQSTTSYTIKNYLVIPNKSPKEKTASEFLVFLNKKDEKGAIINFTKIDETLGILSSFIYSLITRYYNLLSDFNQLKEVKKTAFEIAYELLCFVYLAKILIEFNE